MDESELLRTFEYVHRTNIVRYRQLSEATSDQNERERLLLMAADEERELLALNLEGRRQCD